MPADPLLSDRGVRRRLVFLAGIAAVVFFGCLVSRYWNPVYGFTAFLKLDHSYDTKKIEAFRERPVFVYPDTGDYDGVAYSQIAYHPLLDSPELRPAMDNLGYRARRILPSALAWMLAAGQPALIVQVYCCLNILAWFILAVVLWRLLPVENWRGAIAWAGVLFSAGALVSVRRALTDLIALTILAIAMLALERGRRGRAIGWLAAAALTRETSITALAGFWTPPWFSRANLRHTILAVLPLGSWLLYVWWKVGSSNAGVGNFDWPAFSFASKWHEAVSAIAQGDHSQFAWASLLETIGLTVQVAFMLRPRLGDPWWRIGAANVMLLLLLGPAVWLGFPSAVQRVALPLTLSFNILASRYRAAWIWLIAGNISLYSGLFIMSDRPFVHDLFAVRHGAEACVVQGGDGWFTVQHNRRHVWVWSGGDGELEIQTWKWKAQTLRLGFRLVSMIPRSVAIYQNGRQLWRGKVDSVDASVQIQTSTAPLAKIEFKTDAPAVLEKNKVDPRRVAFAIYDLEVLGPDAVGG
jgi:hypothetical protein